MTSTMIQISNNRLSFGAIEYLIHHMFLPPKLPLKDDFDLGYETVMLNITVDALSKFKEYTASDQNGVIDSVLTMITTLRTVHESSMTKGAVNEAQLAGALKKLCENGDTIPLHIRAQNAGVMISKNDNTINVEVFELSPLNSATITTKGRLRRCFPGKAFALSVETFEQPGFQAMLASTLTKMSYQPAAGTTPKVRKAGQTLDENRDSTHPKLITELLAGILLSVGVHADVSYQWKNTREEVMWLDSLMPWRRSPMWLLIRVAMQLVFCRLTKSFKSSGDIYKMFMVFLMSHVLELSHQHPLPSDLLHTMKAKIVRRLMKLGHSVNGFELSFVHNAIQKTDELIAARWSNIVQQAEPRYDLSRLEHLDFGQDITNSVPALDDYIKSLHKREDSKISAAFQPECALVHYQVEVLPTCLSSSSQEYMTYNLRAFEDWVASELRPWLKQHKEDKNSCCQLSNLIKTYHGVASPIYSGNPEATSMMLLVILELWIACDEVATHTCELLKDYNPGIPREILQSLILPFKSQMDRLLRAEEYLEDRQARAQFGAPSIFRDFGLPNCFSVRYFNEFPNTEHKDLLEEIESRATRVREEKCREFDRKKEQYKSLMSLYHESHCEYIEVIVDFDNDSREQQHRSDCRKCSYSRQANAITIQVHEWPLPSDILRAKSTVFELKVPPFFGHWRDITTSLLLDILKVEYLSINDPQTRYSLNDYQGLSRYFTSFSSTQCIGLLSDTKPHEVTHRRSKSISISHKSDVCLNNGLTYQYYDNRRGTFVGGFEMKTQVLQLYTYKLPEQSRSLQRFLSRPAATPSGPSPNTVIASQSECPDHMSLDEYKALSTIALGYRIQWQNILVQLSAPSVDFKKVESSLVVLQSIYQAGPSEPGNALRASHEITDDERFADALLESLRDFLQRVKENWESSQALGIFISLAKRLLSLASVERIRDECLAYLDSVRAVAFDWVNLLKGRAQSVANDGNRKHLVAKSVEIALTCADSFNIDGKYLNDILVLPDNASVFLQCSIVIQEGSYAILKTSNPMIPILYRRWEWISYRSYTILAKGILEEGSRSLDDAITKFWPAYQAGNRWRAVSIKTDYWLHTTLRSKGDPLCVHFNLLTGELLVNGLPLARLPAKYENHPTYQTLFGHCPLDVMPTAVPGMQFSARNTYSGFTLHFGIGYISGSLESPKQDLLVQAAKDEQTYELVPSRVLRDQFPVSFVDEFVHWYDVIHACLEFRPLKDPWTSSPDNWRLSRAKDGSDWRLWKPAMSLVSIKSQTAVQLSSILSPLENLAWMHIIFHHSSSSLEIELPRLRLNFNLKSGESSIRSRQFRGMVVDNDQSLGTLVGLLNKLMLKHEDDDSRLLVIPEGPVTHEKNKDHVHVIIDKDSAVRTHTYLLDGQLGRLKGNESLQSKLYLCYLHALTSFCLPDPFLRKTGTEEALSILKSAAVRSFDSLAQEHVVVLDQIARLTPRRKFYPAHERVMQTVKWSPVLSFLAQHGEFYKCVKSIFSQGARVKFFYLESHVQPPELDHADTHLLERDCIRSSTFRVSGFGAEDHTVKHDITYKARDRNQDSARESQAFIISSIIQNHSAALHYDVSFDMRAHLWDFFSRTTKVLEPNHPLQSSELMYDADLLLDPHDYIAKHWCALHRQLGQSRPDKYRLMTWFATIAFAENIDMKIVQTLASFLMVPELAQISTPLNNTFHLSKGIKVKKQKLRDAVQRALLPLNLCPEAQLSSHTGEVHHVFKNRQKVQFQKNQKSALDRFTNALVSQWPCEVPTIPQDGHLVAFPLYLNTSEAMKHVKQKFKTWFDNYILHQYLHQIETTLSRQVVSPVETVRPSCSIPTWKNHGRKGFVGIDDVLDCPAPPMPQSAMENLTGLYLSPVDLEETSSLLTTLIQFLDAQARSRYEKTYVEDLRGSLLSLCERAQEYNLQSNGEDVKRKLQDHSYHCKTHVSNVYNSILSAVSAVDRPSVAAGVSQWPRLSPIFLLQQLTRTRWPKLSQDWKKCIVHYGLALTEAQRAERLISSFSKNANFVRELQNSGHTNWSPFEHPESLLLEVESGIMIRGIQEQIAGEMRFPNSGSNAVMQLNMGEGKSSVIIPIVIPALADGSRLVRVIVAKPQFKQMVQMLISKLGGLLDRRVYHLPFSRSLKLSEAEANVIGDICRECMANGGILLVQPEHILSFKLMGLECLISGREKVARSLLRTQEFFDASSRDIVDESDENFSVKFELIYTMGTQRPVELSPERWNRIHQVLDLVRIFGPIVEKEFPTSMEVIEHRPGGFPRIRVLQPDAQQQIVSRIAERICETGLNGFPIARQPVAVRQAVFRYITVSNLTAHDIVQVEDQGPSGFWADSTSGILLLLRGLLAGGVLSYVFGQKRWRVNFGLHATRQPRTKLAVPYRAKDNPHPRSEFSHPDVVIVLTCLSYYYGGLENDDLVLAFERLLDSEDADIEYQAWVKDAPNLPSAFRQLVGVNLTDRFQCIEQVFPPLRFAKTAIDYFLTHIVFPKEMKEFPHKLSASSWDLGQQKAYPTTGFSGTNDSRKTLPIDVQHLDLPNQKHTNALVLEYLLRPENSVALMPPGKEVSGSDGELLLEMVAKMQPPVQVILDVGAQILELSNLEVATQWLKMVPDHDKSQAVLFFNDDDEVSVLDRQGHVEHLQTSAFAKQLDICLVYLDEVHTRGTDLRLPDHYRAAVTLGANLTKDRLVQACMRMRELGKGQSVVFCVPFEIKIQILARKLVPGDINVLDVLSWAISETCIELRRSMPLWAVQGKRFDRQSMLWYEARTNGDISVGQAKRFLENEAQTLEYRYRPHASADIAISGQKGQSERLDLIMERCNEFESLNFNSANIQEEQERQLSPEVEEERQVQRPLPIPPTAHHIHPDLIKFVSTGKLINGSQAFKPAFEALRSTSAAKHFDVSQFGDSLLVTTDFASTVQVSGASYISDLFQRPVKWILTKAAENSSSYQMVDYMVIISPFEAQELLPDIQKSETVALHLYAPRPNLGFPALDSLDLYTIPAQVGTRTVPHHLTIQLNIFAGQLHLASFVEYVAICEFLGLAWGKTEDSCMIAGDGFIIRDQNCQAHSSRFRDSPVRFIKVLMTKVRRNCEGIDKTHMGRILDGRLLRGYDFGELEDGV